MPILPAGMELDKITYGIARMLAQAMPTHTIEKIRNSLLGAKKTESKPMPPISNEKVCVRFLPSFAAMEGSNIAYTADTPLYTAKITPVQSCAS